MTPDLAQPARPSAVAATASGPPRWAWARGLVLRCLVGALVAAALVAAVSALVGEFGPLAVRVLSTIAMSVVVALLILYDAEVSARRSDTFAMAGLAVTGYLLLAGVVEIWVPRAYPSAHGLGTWLVLVVIARVALLHVHLLLDVHRRFPTPGMRLLSRLTFALVALLAALLSLAVVVDDELPTGYWRVVAAVAILDATGTILIPLIHTLFHRERPTPVPAQPPAPSPYAVPQPQHHRTRHDDALGLRPGALPTGARPAVPPDPAMSRYTTPAATPGRLAWPRYEDGRPLPARPDGTPDFTGVALR